MQTERVLIQQKLALRCLAALTSGESCRDSFKIHNILTVTLLHIREVILLSPIQPQGHQDNTRYASKVGPSPHHLSLFEKKQSYEGALLYNHIPEFLRKQPHHSFKTQLTQRLQERLFYTVKEFTDNMY
uniref:Uncharacterized protein n=1 Tax=Graphocephala atropunctata TaxID=36148 RepID=A0A1B6KLW4_9HEMI